MRRWPAGTESRTEETTPADLDPAADGGEQADLEGQLWEKQQQLEEASLYADQLQEKVAPPAICPTDAATHLPNAAKPRPAWWAAVVFGCDCCVAKALQVCATRPWQAASDRVKTLHGNR